MATKKVYAAETGVPVARRQEQIKSELQRLRATSRATLEDDEHNLAVIVFELNGMRYRIILPLPDPEADEYRYTPGRGLERSPAQQRAAWEQACRERWAGLAEYIKAIRVGHETGIIRVEEALLAHVQLPNGQTVGEYTIPLLPEVYRTGAMPPMLPGLPPAAGSPAGALRMLRAAGGGE